MGLARSRMSETLTAVGQSLAGRRSTCSFGRKFYGRRADNCRRSSMPDHNRNEDFEGSPIRAEMDA